MVETRATKRAKELLERDSKHCHPVLVVEKPNLLEKWPFKQAHILKMGEPYYCKLWTSRGKMNCLPHFYMISSLHACSFKIFSLHPSSYYSQLLLPLDTRNIQFTCLYSFPYWVIPISMIQIWGFAMTSLRLSIDLEASIETIIVICTVIFTIVWMISSQQYKQSSILLGLNSKSNDSQSTEWESESTESECRTDHLLEEEWIPGSSLCAFSLCWVLWLNMWGRIKEPRELFTQVADHMNHLNRSFIQMYRRPRPPSSKTRQASDLS